MSLRIYTLKTPSKTAFTSIKSRCYSKCRGLTKSVCNKPNTKCSYTNGAIRKYCKLNTKKYKLNEKCDSIRRQNKTNRDSAALRINRFLQARLKKQKIVNADKHSNKSSNKQHKSPKGIIGRFMRKTSKKRRAEFLKKTCNDSGVCIAFGKESAKIFDFFSGFTDFVYLHSTRRVGSVSVNGFIQELKYTRLGYDSYAIMKSNRGPHNDNLVYEYMVGQFINKMCIQFPCFVETYGLYKYNDDASWTHARDTANIANNTLSGLVTLQPNVGLHNWQTMNWDDACQNSKLYSILIQHIKSARSLYDMMNSATASTFIGRDLLYVLYQIYMPLSTIGDKYTHYDLHTENVQIYEPVRGKYIQYHYHVAGGLVVSFKSPYVAKIIDYGRSYFMDSINDNSKRIHSHICMVGNCRPKCGDDFGFTFLNSENVFGEFGYIVSQKPNISHDLRLLHMLKPAVTGAFIIKQVINDVVYDVKTRAPFKNQGTKENKVAGKGGKINNINDAYTALESMIGGLKGVGYNDRHYPDDNHNKLGELHIYHDGRAMRWIAQ